MPKSSLPKMNPLQKAKWTSALRSGKYKKGTGGLINEDGNAYCCLGVAQCVLGKRQPLYGHDFLADNRFGLSEPLQHALASANDGGLSDEFRELGVPQPRLSGNGKASFNALANWIDKYL